MNSQLYLGLYSLLMEACIIVLKSDLIKILEAIPPKVGRNRAASQHQQNLIGMRLPIVDGMAEVQAIDKPESIKTCKDLGDHFAVHMKSKFGTYDDLHVIFDDYTE